MNNKEPKIGIVIVNYNGLKFQNECIESIINCHYSNYYIIVVDNNSKDGSMEKLKEINDERIITIYLDDNYGIAKGNNVGIEKSLELKTDYTMLLNNDTIVDKDFINNLLIENEDVIVPKILFYNTNLLWYGGGKLVPVLGKSKHLNYKKEDVNMVYKNYYTYSPTCCMLIKNKVFDIVGLMDETYFLYADDLDFCMRLHEKKIRIRFAETSLVHHKVGLSSNGENSRIFVYYTNRNRFYLIKKYKLGFLAYLYSYLTRYLKYYKSFIDKSNNRLIKKAIKDYKHKNMGRCDDL